MKKFRDRSKKIFEEISYPRNLRRGTKQPQLLDQPSTSAEDCSLTNDFPNFNINSLYSNISLETNNTNDFSNFNFNNLELFSLINNDMADALRSTVTLLKTFDGTPSHLEAFVKQIDTFHNRYFNNDLSQQEYVNLAIKSKITGSAEDFLLTRSDLTTWDEIKTALRQKFSDPLTRANLQQQLIFLTKKNESTQDYIQKLKALVTKINTKICTDIANIEARTILINQNELTATQNLLANISSELRTLLIVQNPQNLDTAIDIITNYEVLISQNNFKNTFLQNHSQTKNLKPTTTTSNFSNSNNYQNNRTNQFKSQKQFKPLNQSNQTNKNQSSSKQTYPQPMSGVSIQPRKNMSIVRHTQKPFQQTGKPNFTFQELTHVDENNFENDSEFDYSDNQINEYDDNTDQSSTVDETLAEQLENFQLQASE